ncbi:hypothetical protein BDV25DRAFT_137303 [Aspergillus avenaceus]|uniref:Beta-ketoacyl synthase-like N-terminal domain-containing protein n=1 Tax=Aspergillus avenaceus TaxID=36643 RepID=A0A5N6U492_ASPAV|nr:hypothetical protein BDV25DRAFT_137303 [Aspergillus avenaceus]
MASSFCREVMRDTRSGTGILAVIGLAIRLQGKITSPEGLWDLLVRQENMSVEIPKTATILITFTGSRTAKARRGSFLEQTLAEVHPSAFDNGNMVNHLDPQQISLPEITFECLENADRHLGEQLTYGAMLAASARTGNSLVSGILRP